MRVEEAWHHHQHPARGRVLRQFAGRGNGSLYWAIVGAAPDATALVIDEATAEVFLMGRAVLVAAEVALVTVSQHASAELLSVDLKTMDVERVRERHQFYLEGPASTYKLPWPPILKA